MTNWKPFSWYCPNCGKLVTGYMNSEGNIKLECPHCKVVMIRKIKRRSNSIEIYKPAS